MGKIISIVSGKGGVGKSTVASCLGTALARRDRLVVLVDCDAGLRSLDLMLGIASETVFDLSDILEGNCTPAKATYPVPGQKGLYVIAAPYKAEYILDIQGISNLIKNLSLYYDYVLLDSPAGIGDGFKAATSVCDMALVVTTCDPVSIRDAGNVGRLLNSMGIQRRLVINKVNYNLIKKYFFPNLDAVIDETSMKLIAAIPDDSKILLSTFNGQPLKGNSAGCMAFNNLAARIEGERIPLSIKIFKPKGR